MADARVSKRYAQALFTTALKFDVVKSVEEDLAGIASLLQNDEKFRHFMLSPYVDREQKLRIADRLFSDRITALSMKALRLMIEKRREDELVTLRTAYLELRREHERALRAVVTSAEAIEPDQRLALEKKLAEISGKVIEAEYRIDARLIGGIKVAFGDYVMDGTLRGSLRRMKERLQRDLLKQA